MKVWKVLWYGNSVYTNIETQQNLQGFDKNASQVTQIFFGILFLPGHAYRELSRFSWKGGGASNFSHEKGVKYLGWVIRVGKIWEVVLNMRSSYILFILTNSFQCYLSECLVCMCLFCLFTPFSSVLIVSWEEVTTDTWLLQVSNF